MEPTFRDYLATVSKRRWLLAVVLLLVVGSAAVATAATTPKYEAEAKLFVGQQQFAVSEVAEGVQAAQLSVQLLRSYAQILQTRPMAERAVEKEGIDISPAQLAHAIKAEPIPETQLIRLAYRSTDAAEAQLVVNTVSDVFTEEIQRLQKPTQGEPAIQVRVVEPALRPEEPVSPSAVRNLALALVLGLLLGVGAVFLAESLDTTVKDRHDVERLVGAPVLATVPRIQTGGAEVYLERDPQSMGAEAFRKVRTAIQFLGVDRPIKVLLITSPFPREGKTTTALNLAASFAQAGMKTVLLEADLRRPTLHRVFASEQEKGLTTCLVGRISLQQAVLPTPVRNLSHIPAGAIPPNPAELLSSQHMGKVLSALQAEFDMVVVDAPPLLPVADTPALAHRVDGVLLVARAGQTNRERLRESAELLQTVGGRLLGVIVNFQRVEDSPEGYQYYGYRSSKQAFESPAGTGRAVAQKADRPPNGAVSERGRASKRA